MLLYGAILCDKTTGAHGYGPTAIILHCEVIPLVRCYVIWDSMSLDQVLCKPFASVMAGALCTGKESPYLE